MKFSNEEVTQQFNSNDLVTILKEKNMADKHDISFNFSINKGYYGSEIVKLSITETVPEGKCPVDYLRERLGTEIKRVTKDVQFNVELSV